MLILHIQLDGQNLAKPIKNQIVTEVIGDMAYVSDNNLKRLKFEEKNGDLKEAIGLCRADSRGLFAMHLQMYFTAFTANVKRIVRLKEMAME
ncbi:hypothetical protein [Faecalimonas sp.]